MNQIIRYAELVCRIILGGTFLYAGAIKATSSGEFAMALIPFTFVPETWIGPISKALPLVEILGGVLVLLPWTKRYGAALLLLLCLAFIAALGWALANDIIVACSCFGQDEEPSAFKMKVALGRDLLLVAASVVVLLARPAPRTTG